MWPGSASNNTSSVCLSCMVRRLHEVPWAFSDGERALYKRQDKEEPSSGSF